MRISDIDDFCVFDTETTGTNREVDRIVTAYIGLMNSAGELKASKSWIINPGVDIPEEASAVHGISTEQAIAEGMDPAVAIPQIVALLEGRIARGTPISAYNMSFDTTILDRESRRYGGPGFATTPGMIAIDPFIIDKGIDKYRRGKRKLAVTAEHYGVPLGEDAHDAEADAVATGRVALAVLAHLPQNITTMEELHERQIQWAREQGTSLQAYLRSDKNPAGANPDVVIDYRWPIAPFGDIAA